MRGKIMGITLSLGLAFLASCGDKTTTTTSDDNAADAVMADAADAVMADAADDAATSANSATPITPKYPAALFSMARLHVDAERSPHGIDWYLKSREGKDIVGAAAAYMGIDPIYVALALEAAPPASKDGEETNYSLPIPPGYTFCAARVAVTSIVPADGERASIISAGSSATGVVVYTWTPVRNPGEGRSWVDADVQLMGIKPEFLAEFTEKGVCKPPAQEIMSCRGHCGGVEWGAIQEAGPTTGDLKKGF